MDMVNLNDEELIRRFYDADQEALKMLFKRYKDPLFNFSLRLSGNRADAEDAVAHTFMMVCEKRYAPTPAASFKTWAYTVARNKCLTKLRSHQKFFSLWFSKDDGQEQVDLPDPSDIARDQLSNKEMQAIIQKAIGGLVQEQKEALLLREYQGLSYAQIAQVLGCTQANVKILIFRARQQLKNVLPSVLLEEGRPL